MWVDNPLKGGKLGIAYIQSYIMDKYVCTFSKWEFEKLHHPFYHRTVLCCTITLPVFYVQHKLHFRIDMGDTISDSRIVSDPKLYAKKIEKCIYMHFAAMDRREYGWEEEKSSFHICL